MKTPHYDDLLVGVADRVHCDLLVALDEVRFDKGSEDGKACLYVRQAVVSTRAKI